MEKLTKKCVNELTYKIIGACIEVHKIAGPGLYKYAYHKCLEREFQVLGISMKVNLRFLSFIKM